MNPKRSGRRSPEGTPVFRLRSSPLGIVPGVVVFVFGVAIFGVGCGTTSTTQRFLAKTDDSNESIASATVSQDPRDRRTERLDSSFSRPSRPETPKSVLARVGAGDGSSISISAQDLLPLFMIDSPGEVDAALMNRVQAVIAEAEARRLGIRILEEETDLRVEELLSEQEKRLEEAMGRSVPLEDFVRFQYDIGFEAYEQILRRRVEESLKLERLVRFEAWQEDRRSYGVIVVDDEEKALEIAQKLRDGANFAVLAQTHSDHLTKDRGGELPPLPVSFQSPLTEGGVRLDVGEFTSPDKIESPSGEAVYRILELRAILPARPGTWADLSDEICAEIAEQPVDPTTELQAWEQKMMSRYDVTIRSRDLWIEDSFFIDADGGS